MNIPFVDLQSQYKMLKEDVDAAVLAVMQRGDFVTRDPMTAAATAVSIALGPMLMYHNGNVANQALCEQMTQDAAEAALNYLRGHSEPTVLTNERNTACVLSDA